MAEPTAAAVAEASLGLRFAQRQARTGGETRRAMIDRPSSQRSRSIAKSPAEAIARLRLALQTACADCLQVAIERRYERAQFRRRFFAGLLNHSQSVFAQKRRTPGEQIEQNCSETVNVCRPSKLGCRSFGLLGCDVTRRTEDCECAREIGTGVEPFGQSEIGHEWFAATVEQDVSRLEIAM